MTARFPTLALLSSLALGCTAEDPIDEGDDVIEPSLDGKHDTVGGAKDQGLLGFGDEAAAEFDADFQFYAYTFDARANADITVEVTQKGSSQGLDTTLFLYRVNDGDEPSRIAFDDDEGFGALSKIEDFRLFSDDRYIAVVGTKGADGRGKFRITLTCNSGDCGPVTPPDDACPGVMQEAIAECLDEVGRETDLEVPFDVIVAEDCGTKADLEVLRENLCANASHEWCTGSEVINACETFSLESYPPSKAAEEAFEVVDEAAMNTLTDAVHDGPNCGSLGPDAGCEFFGGVLRHDPADVFTLAELMAVARLLLPTGPGVAALQEVRDAGEVFRGTASFFETTDEADALIDALDLDLDDAVAMTAFADGFNFQFGDCQADLLVVHFPEDGIMLNLSSMFCEG